MKDYELVQKLEHDLFRKTETLNFLKASTDALDDSIEEKRLTFEKMVAEYNDKVKRAQDSMERIKDEIATILNKLNDAKGVQFDNAKKRALMHKVKKIKEAKEIKKEPEPVFIQEDPFKIIANIPEKEPEPEITPEEIIETVPEETEKNENGKKTCPFCGEEFAPQGFKSHLRKCISEITEIKEGLP